MQDPVGSWHTTAQTSQAKTRKLHNLSTNPKPQHLIIPNCYNINLKVEMGENKSIVTNAQIIGLLDFIFLTSAFWFQA